MRVRKVINIATTIVWERAKTIDEFANNISSLVDSLNHIAYKRGLNFEVKKAVIDVHSISNSKLLKQYKNVSFECYNTPVNERKEKGMAHWWFTAVRRAFHVSSQVNNVLFYPVDVCWVNQSDNSVVNPSRLSEFLQLMPHNSTELLLIGNYKSTNPNKERIEKVVRDLLVENFPRVSDNLLRVRSEFWGISRKLFDNFEKTVFKLGRYPDIEDPTLLLIMYCLHEVKKIVPFNLGTYKVYGEWNQDKSKQQIERARNLIHDYNHNLSVAWG